MNENAPVPLENSARVTGRKAKDGGEPLEDLCKMAKTGHSESVEKLIDWATTHQEEEADLKRKLRKQELDFSTLFEIVGQTSARSLELNSMQTYLLRTVSGHFTTPRLIIYRKPSELSSCLTASDSQGLRDVKLEIPIDCPLGKMAVQLEFCLQFDQLPKELAESPEIIALKKMGLVIAVPLVQEVEATEPVLEGFLFLGPRLANRAYTPADLEFLNTLGKMLAICLRNESLYRRSIIDDLTQVASRGHFDAMLSQEINRTQVYHHRSLGLLMLDIDKFKGFNDTYGHQTGDLVLKNLAVALENTVRNVDLVARYGGEEFAIILLEIDRQGISDVAERVRKSVERMKLNAVDGTPLKVTASLGAACFPEDAEHKAELIQVADQALYKAKETGRNRVVMCSTGKQEPPKEEDKPGSSSADRRRPSGRLTMDAGKNT